jgi:hypothetical protein
MFKQSRLVKSWARIKEFEENMRLKARTFFSLAVCVPLLSSAAPNFSLAKERDVAPTASANITRREENKLVCSFDGTHLLVRTTAKKVKKLSLDIPDGVELKNILAFVCEKRYTIIVTPDYIVRAVGYQDVLDGREMLGLLLDDSFYPQNAIFIKLKPLGTIQSGFVKGRKVVLRSEKGEFLIDTDRPSEPAIILKSTE